MKKIACLFPGIGYTCDKPLLYYSGKLLKSLGWEIVPVQYSGFPSGVKGNAEKMRQCAQTALEQAEGILRETDWNEYGEILSEVPPGSLHTGGGYIPLCRPQFHCVPRDRGSLGGHEDR